MVSFVHNFSFCDPLSSEHLRALNHTAADQRSSAQHIATAGEVILIHLNIAKVKGGDGRYSIAPGLGYYVVLDDYLEESDEVVVVDPMQPVCVCGW